ncbi:MAG TPA: putative Ig domain-containing protein, partial [Coleofasciculaceae cyanobacterium]
MPNLLVVTNINDNGLGSLREAIALAQSGDTITFDPSIANQTLILTTGQIEISPGKTLNIDGANVPNLIISGNGSSRIFYVNSNQDFPAGLTLKNLTLINGYTSDRGGAIQVTNKGALTVENVEFKDNVADKGGGAIYTEWETTLTVNGSKFDCNKAIAGNDERGAGAITFLSPGSFTVKDSEFTNNQGINGGAINSLNGKLTIENSKFINNDTTSGYYDTGKPNPFLRGFGGAVYTDRASSTSEPDGGTIQITNSVFQGNKGRGEGGAAYLFTAPADNVVIEGSLFENNEILALPNGGNDGNGGAVVQLSDELNQGLTISNTTFANNTAANQGGGLWTMRAPTTITNSTFSGNKTLGDTFSSVGGGMALYSPTDIENTTIANNKAGWVGGGVAASNEPVTVKNTIFYNNTSDNGPNDWGIQQHTSRELTDLGGNVQYPPKATNNFNDYNATATITIIDPQLGSLQDNGGLVPTHAVENPLAQNAGAVPVLPTNPDNNPPTLVSAISDSTATADQPFSLTISNNFQDSDANDTLSFSAILAGGGELPSWLNFDPTTGTFSGTPTDATVGKFSITVTANDGNGESIADTFDLMVNPSSTDTGQLVLSIQNDILNIESNSKQAKLQFTLTGGDSEFVNEIGAFVVDDAQGTINGIAP